jgi:hypothetical protein
MQKLMMNTKQVKSKSVQKQDRVLFIYTLAMLLVYVLCAWSSSAYAAKGQGKAGAAGAGVVVRGGGVFAPAPLLTTPTLPPAFDITGFIQEATLDSNNSICQASDVRLQGGTVKVNGITVIIPCNTILQMPAATLTWQELFSLAPRDIGLPLDSNGVPTQTGMAQKDTVNIPFASAQNGPLPSYEIHVIGNVVNGKYIAGLVFISQQSLNLGSGIISAIDYDNGELLVDTKGSIVRVRINDPIGRYGPSHGALDSNADLKEAAYDVRFSIDEESPTIHAATGYPMCIPRYNPANNDDTLCPQANRPRSPNCLSLPTPYPAFTLPARGQFCTSFMMPVPSDAPNQPDARLQTPFEVGDNIDFLGNTKFDVNGAYISANTIAANLGIYTSPGSAPAYVGLEALLQGTSSQPLPNLPQEATSRIKVEGFSTDPFNLVDIYAIDVDPRTGIETERLLGTANPSGPPVIGRFRFLPNSGAFLPATREARVVSRTMCSNPTSPCSLADVYEPNVIAANGIIAGQYHAPNFEFIFAEALTMGDAVVPANLQDLAFLYCGSGPLGTPTAGDNGPVVGQLDPAPWAPPMPTPSFAANLCAGAPVVGAAAVTAQDAPPVITLFPSAAMTVNSASSVFLSATASDASGMPIAINWVQSAGTSALSPLVIPPNQPNALTFKAPFGPAQMVFTASATSPSTGLTANAEVTIDVSRQPADAIAVNSAVWTNTVQNRGILSVTATSNMALDENGMPPVGMQLFVQATANVAALVPDGSGGLVFKTSIVQLAATPLPMFFADTGPLGTCPGGAARCWQFTTRGALVDPSAAGVFIAPDDITVTSSFGGKATATQNNGGITLR